jgi:hypothetical protein
MKLNVLTGTFHFFAGFLKQKESGRSQCPGKSATLPTGLSGCANWNSLSGRQDLNLRPLGPQPSALPDYATPRFYINQNVNFSTNSNRDPANLRPSRQTCRDALPDYATPRIIKNPQNPALHILCFITDFKDTSVPFKTQLLCNNFVWVPFLSKTEKPARAFIQAGHSAITALLPFKKLSHDFTNIGRHAGK